MKKNELLSIHTNFIEKLPDNISMITKVWGPPTWFFLHSMAMSYPKKINEKNPEHLRTKNSMFSVLSNLGDILPCPLCGNSYNNYIRRPELSIWDHLDTRGNLIEFIYKIHNKVNEKLGVPKCDIPSFKEVVEYYSKFIAGPCKATTEQEKQNRLLLGCNNSDIEEGKFKDFKCNINIVDKNNNKGVNIENKIENFVNEPKKQPINITIIFIILTLILILILMVIFYKNKHLL